MIKRFLYILICICVLFSAVLCGCGRRPEAPAAPAVTAAPAQDIPTSTLPPSAAPSPSPVAIATATAVPTAVPTATPEPTATPGPTPVPTPEPTALPAHSTLYRDGYTAEDILRFFNEVCLDSEFVNSGDPSFVQKWTVPISYMLHGAYTQKDYEVLTGLVDQLNGIYGFPGMLECREPGNANLNIYFCTQQELNDRMGAMAQNESLDGAVTFWYDGMNQIYDATICIRTDLEQTIRSSVILEEIYNGLGPIQDTTLRPDSIIYQYASTALSLSDMDDLILQLLYHPDMRCGMGAAEAESVIRSLYY